MAGYGFRLYTVKLVSARRKSKGIDFAKCGVNGDQHVSAWLLRAFDLLEDYEPLVGPPVLHHAEDEDAPPAIGTYVKTPKRGEYRTNFVKHTKSRPTRIRFRFEYGRTGKVSIGLGEEGTIPLGHIPTGDAYRGVLYLPKSGTKGLLALESVPSAPNPQRMLNAWLARAAQDLKLEDDAALATQRSPSDDADPQAFKLNFNQYPNVARIEKAVENSPAAKVVLRKEAIDGQGTPNNEAVILTSTLSSQTRRTNAAGLAGAMVRSVLGTPKKDEEPVTLEDLEELVEGSLNGIEWTEGYIQIEDETGLKNIGLDKIDKYFVYPLNSAVALTDIAFEKAVAKEVVSLQAALGLELDLA